MGRARSNEINMPKLNTLVLLLWLLAPLVAFGQDHLYPIFAEDHSCGAWVKSLEMRWTRSVSGTHIEDEH
jgi:hypothetical protein